jgi:hypothetical protein
MIPGFHRYVLEYVAKPHLQQNANTGVFLLGDFWRVHALSGWGDLREDRLLVLSYTLLIFLERFYVVKVRAGRVIFRLTILHFRVTILRIGAGRWKRGLGQSRISVSHK